MNAVACTRLPVESSVDAAVEAACRLIAPTWPLDRFIAVNPYWGWVDRPIEEAAAQLAQLGGSRMHMPRAFYRDAFKNQAFQTAHLAQAMQDYALERLPHLKGAPQEARRINVYLRAAGLRLLEVTELKQVADAPGKAGLGAYYRVELVAHTNERVIPNGLHQHRKAQLSANAGTDRRRAANHCVGPGGKQNPFSHQQGHFPHPDSDGADQKSGWPGDFSGAGPDGRPGKGTQSET